MFKSFCHSGAVCFWPLLIYWVVCRIIMRAICAFLSWPFIRKLKIGITLMKTRVCRGFQIKNRSWYFGTESTAKVLIATRWSWRSMHLWTFGRMGSCHLGNEDRRGWSSQSWRCSALRLSYFLNQYVNEFISGAHRKPFKEKLVYLGFCYLVSHIAGILATKLIHIY